MKFDSINLRSGILFEELEKGKLWTSRQDNCRIILVVSGKLKVFFTRDKNEKFYVDGLFFLPAGYSLSAEALSKSLIVSIDISDENHLYNNFRIKESKCIDKQGISHLCFNHIMNAYINSLLTYRDKNVDYNLLAEIKVKELIYILKASYTEEQLFNFFCTYQTNDSFFTERVRILSYNTKNIKELAYKTNYSYSGFNKKFRKVFGTTAYSWLKKQRTNMVYHDIYHTDKTLKQISTDNKFCSLSHFNEFCHKNLGKSPSEIRRKRSLENINKKQSSVT
ncbi:AraC family transcriptional regulator [Dysgonomonas sp. 520]|uniref:helix-turn-helix domain-containing protein n=1 Tax=Dysgonomonas sp. 520 TaxID=2302931 RepID=UPI0013D05866|nr:helix-turn-helix domain-containing protein [Dysgonomonas sp. 520]NDW09979.1 AraC family transcriptional regulator [Dysgonomonas sp. 520]